MKNTRYYIPFFIIMFLCFILPAEAMAQTDDEYYENENGVIFSKKEYDFFSKMYWEGYQSLVTPKEYEKFAKLGVMEEIVETNVSSIPQMNIMPYGTTITAEGRTLKISKACTTNCILVVTLNWLISPPIKSYDVIGAYFDGTLLVGIPETTIVVGNSKTEITDLKKTANGIGSSFKLPSGFNVKVTQTFTAKKDGHVYASYQHAVQNSSLAISKDYSFSKLGYGSVFSFSTNAKKYYDGMNGVDIEV